MKYNNVTTCKDTKKHYLKAKGYCILFRIKKYFNEGNKLKGFQIEVNNTKTKQKFNTRKDWGLYFRTINDAKIWCEKYARYTYFDLYNEYKDWIGIEEPLDKDRKDIIPGIKTEIIWRPKGGEEVWKELKKKDRESIELYKNDFEGKDFNINTKNVLM